MVPRGIPRVVLAAALALSLCAPAFSEDATDAPPDGPAATIERAEKMIFSGAPAAALALLLGFVPAPSLVYERRGSNIADVFDYSRQRAELTMRRRL